MLKGRVPGLGATCAAQHVDVDPGRHHVLGTPRQDADALAAEHLCRVAGRCLQEGVPLALRLLNVPPVSPDCL